MVCCGGVAGPGELACCACVRQVAHGTGQFGQGVRVGVSSSASPPKGISTFRRPKFTAEDLRLKHLAWEMGGLDA